MNTFTFIISSYFPETDIFKTAFEFPENRNSPINRDFVAYSFLNTLHFGKIKYDNDNKFQILNNSIVKNIFIEEDRKKHFILAFCESQQIYDAFCKIARFFKVKKAKTFDVDTDLFMNPLSSLKQNIILKLYDDETKTNYIFRISDLINIINNSLSNSPEFFCDPQKIKNPYTNIPFSKAQLYHIYFTIKDSSFLMPQLFHLFFLKNFNIEDFSKYNECYIRDVAIIQFIKSASDEQKYYQIHKMLDDHSREMDGMAIAYGFPKVIVIEAFSRYLNDYLEEAYSLNPTIRYQARRKLRIQLTKFKKLNPTFGRRILTRSNSYNSVRTNRTSPYIFGNVESPASIIGNQARTIRYVENFTLDSPRITPRQMNYNESRSIEHPLISTLNTTSTIEEHENQIITSPLQPVITTEGEPGSRPDPEPEPVPEPPIEPVSEPYRTGPWTQTLVRSSGSPRIEHPPNSDSESDTESVSEIQDQPPATNTNIDAETISDSDIEEEKEQDPRHPTLLDLAAAENMLLSESPSVPLLNNMADESVSVDYESDIETPVSSLQIRREMEMINRSLDNTIADLMEETANEIIDNMNITEIEHESQGSISSDDD